MKRWLWLGMVLTLGGFAQSRSLSCRENCQVFDSFNQVCDYMTRCQFDESSRCVTQTRCERWDNFDRVCKYEGKLTHCHVPNPWVPPPACQQTCQYWDDFEQRCLYETRCEYFAQNCAALTRCENWDSFNRVCLSQEKSFQCP
jgi:hypothetical protein